MLRLLQNDQYRRVALRSFLSLLRPYLTLTFAAASGAAALLAALLIDRLGAPPAAFEALTLLTITAGVALGSLLYHGERQSGMLELVWLASGTAGQMLLQRQLAAVLLLQLLTLPTTLVLATFSGSLAIGVTQLSLLVPGSLSIALAVWGGSLTKQSWTGTVAALLLLGSLYAIHRGEATMLNPFVNPFQRGGSGAIPFASAVLWFGVSVLLLRAAAKRSQG
jgi:hypothetical protein